MSMDLEKRVQQLEEELEILKNQIQMTLLDIQEQLLTNAYPSLRSEHQPSAPNMPAPQAPASVYTPPPPEPVAQAESAPIKVRKISLDDLASQPPAAPQFDRYNDVPNDEINMDEYRRWVIRNMKEVGLKETRNRIRSCSHDGDFPPEVRDELLQIAARYAARQNAKKQAQQQPPAPPKPAPAAKPVTRTKAPAAQPQPRMPSQPAPYPPADDLTRPSRSTRIVAPPPVPKPEEEEKEEHSSLILRLMAGVQNAGAGVKWSKKNNG
jgi:hypothetical protein